MNTHRRQRVLVTGGAGFLGSHLCERLLQNGSDIICVDNFVHGKRWAVKWGLLVEGNLSDADALERHGKTIRSRPLFIQ